MGVDTMPSSPNSFLQLYNEFASSLGKEDNIKLGKMKQYCGNEKLMRIFLQCYCQDRVPSTAGNEVLRNSSRHFAKKENRLCILNLYKLFKKWVETNPDSYKKVVDENYKVVTGKILSGVDSTVSFEDDFLSREDYLGKPGREEALFIWKELHIAYGPKTLRKLFWDSLPLILFNISSDKDSYATQLLNDEKNKGMKKQEVFGCVVDKILDDLSLAKKELRPKTNELLGNMEGLRHRIHKIVGFYSGWSKIRACEKVCKGDIGDALKTSDEHISQGSIDGKVADTADKEYMDEEDIGDALRTSDKYIRKGIVNGEIVDVVNGEYKDEEGNMHPYFGEAVDEQDN